jgi:hypothetical protein
MMDLRGIRSFSSSAEAYIIIGRTFSASGVYVQVPRFTDISIMQRPAAGSCVDKSRAPFQNHLCDNYNKNTLSVQND